MAQDIIIVNGTTFPIYGLALSASESESWGDDLLGDAVLQPGEGLQVSLGGSPSGWDMAVVDDEGQQLMFQGLDFTGYSSVTLYSDGTAVFE